VTLFLDTSALIKIYIAEPGSEEIHEKVAAAHEVAVSLVTFAEGRAGLAALLRTKRIAAPAYRQAKLAWDTDWSGLCRVPPTEALCREAGDMAERFGLRGFDSIQLASFAQLARGSGATGVEFRSFDQRLSAAAKTWLAALRR
jgi:uncharacterized protein